MNLKDKLKSSNKKVIIAFIIIMIIAILVRAYKFPYALKEVNTDEMMTAVNAKSIAETGQDINGISYPVYLLGWGGQSVVLVYFTAICIKIFGYSLFAIRLPMLIISIISLFVFYDLIRRISKNNIVALIGLALVAISPWHMLQSIWSLDCNMFPHILLIAVYLLYVGITKQKRLILYLSMVFFSLTLYSYGIAIYFTPILLLVLAIYLKYKKRISIADLIICIIIFAILSIPIILMFAINLLKTNEGIYLGSITIPYYENLSRTDDMLFFSQNIIMQFLENICYTIIMIFAQTDGCEWNSSPIFGTVYHITVIFALISLIALIKEKRRKKKLKENYKTDEMPDENKNFAKVIVLSWLCTSIFTGLVINQTNINRLNTIWYPIIILATFGIYWIYKTLKNREANSNEEKNKNNRKAKIYVITTISIFTILFVSYVIYFNVYFANKVDMSICFSRGMYQALKYTNTVEEENVIVDNLEHDGSIDIYVRSNEHFSNKSYNKLDSQEKLDEALQNLNENEILIVNEKRGADISNFDYTKIGEYYIVTVK